MSSCGEAVTILGALRAVVNELGVTVRVCHGFGSTGMEGQNRRVVRDHQEAHHRVLSETTIRSGHDIECDLHPFFGFTSADPLTIVVAVASGEVRGLPARPQSLARRIDDGFET